MTLFRTRFGYGGHDHGAWGSWSEHEDGENESLLHSLPRKKVLTRREINKARMDIEDTHPLRKVVGVKHISPWIGYLPCFSKRNIGFRLALRECVCAELGVKIPESEQGLLEQPFLMAGYGVNAYFQILDHFRWMFIMITLFCLPLFYIYGTGNGLKGWKSFPVTRFTMGNLGGSSTMCKHQILSRGHIRLFCPPTSVVDANNAVFGVLSNQFETHEYCHQDEVDKVVQANSFTNCSTVLKREAMRRNIQATCHNKQKCEIDTSQMVEEGAFHDQDMKDHCKEEAYLFVQAPCLVPRENLPQRKIIGLSIGCLGVFIYLFVQVFVEYVKSVEENNYIEWDIQTITAADYTVEFELEPEMFSAFKNKFFDPTNPLSEIAQFRLYIKGEMEQRLTEFPGLGYEGTKGDNSDVKIAMVTFAYKNAEIIKELTARGTAIKKENYRLLDHINKHVLTHLSQSQEFLDKLQTPCSAFVTCETEEGFNRALKYNDTVKLREFQHYQTLLYHEITVREASEPTDIIWENRHLKPIERFYKRCLVFMIIFAILCFSFRVIFGLQKRSLAMKGRYPSGLCDDYNEQYTNRRNQWMNDAFHEYLTKARQLEHGSQVLFTGPMQCFCKKERKLGHAFSEEYTYTDAEGVEYAEPICREFFVDLFLSKVLGQSIAFIVVGINVILKFTVMYLVKYLGGEDTASNQKAVVTRGVFLGQFANTGFVILLVNANLSEHFPQQITENFRGPFYDYTPMWYIDCGLKIMIAMLIQMCLPFISVTLAHLVPFLKQRYDNRGTGDPFVTRSTTIAWYKWFNGGSEYMIHFKYSDALNVTYVALTYGLAMPILFPIAAITLKLQQTFEKVAIAWCARLPPAMDNALNNNALSMVTFAPMFLLMNGFWMIDNKIIFDNFWEYRMRVNESMRSGHVFEGFVVTQATPLLLFVAFSWALHFIHSTVPEETLARFGFTLQKEQISVDEDLPSFFEAIKLKQADEIVSEYYNIKNRYGLEIEDADVIKKLERIRIPEKSMQGTPWYSVLSNHDYTDRFNFYGAVIKDRTAFIKDINKDKNVQSDVCVLLLNLSAIPDEILQNFHHGIENYHFQDEFLQSVRQYRKKFERRYGVKWEYQNQNNVKRYYAFKRKRQGQQLNPSYQGGKGHPRFLNLEQSFYVSESNRSRDNSTDAFTGVRRVFSGDFNSPLSHTPRTIRGTHRHIFSGTTFSNNNNIQMVNSVTDNQSIEMQIQDQNGTILSPPQSRQGNVAQYQSALTNQKFMSTQRLKNVANLIQENP